MWKALLLWQRKLWYKTIQWILLKRIWNNWYRMHGEWNSLPRDGKRTRIARINWPPCKETNILVDWTNWKEREVCRMGWNWLSWEKRT